MAEQPETSKPTPELPENHSQDSTEQSMNSDGAWYGTRRDLLKGAAKAVGVLAGIPVAVAAAKGLADILVPPHQEQPNTPEVLNSQIEFGFNTHVHAVKTGENDNMTIDAFRGDVDRLVSENQKWIRFNFINNGVVEKNPDGSVGFSDKTAVFDEAIRYAKEKGLKIALVTNVPEFAAHLPIDQYMEVAKSFYTELAKKYKGMVNSWQLFNEADTHHFRDYRDISQGFDIAYLDELSRVIEASASAIRSQDPDAEVTMNASLWAPDRNIIRDRTSRFFDPLVKHLDFVSLDPYPDVYDPNSAQTIPQDVEFFSKRYNKDIIIAEMGVSAHDISDKQKRANILLSQLSAIKSGLVKPRGVFIYEMRNENAVQDLRERAFGTEEILGELTQSMQTSQISQTNQTPV